MRLQLLFTLKFILKFSFPFGQHRNSLVTWLPLQGIYFLPIGTRDESTGNIYFIGGWFFFMFFFKSFPGLESSPLVIRTRQCFLGIFQGHCQWRDEKKTTITSSFLALIGWPGLNFTCEFSISPFLGHRGMGNGCCNQFIRCLWHSFPIRGMTPPTLSQHGSFLWLKFFTNCPSVSPFHGCCPSGMCSSMGSHRVTASFGHPCSGVESSPGCRQILLQQGFHGLQGHSCLSKVCPTGYREISVLALDTPFPSLPHWHWCLQVCFCHRFSLLAGCICSCAVTAFPLISQLRGAATITAGLSLSQQQVHLWGGWTWGNLLAASNSSHPPPKLFLTNSSQPPFLTSTVPQASGTSFSPSGQIGWPYQTVFTRCVQ